VPARETGLLWLASAQLATGSAAAACTTARDGAAAASAPHIRTLFDVEQGRACGGAAVPRAQQTVPPPQQPAQTAVQPPPTQAGRNTAVPALTGDFAVQTGAFRELRSAETVAAQMRARGLDVRVVLVGDSPLYRVRSGAFATSNEANSAAARIRNEGFAVVIVNDVQQERR
jgi:cell division protein FtsN